MSRILVVSQHYWPENFRVTDLCEGLVAQGIEVDVLCGLPTIPWAICLRAILTFPPAAKPTTKWKFFGRGKSPERATLAL